MLWSESGVGVVEREGTERDDCALCRECSDSAERGVLGAEERYDDEADDHEEPDECASAALSMAAGCVGIAAAGEGERGRRVSEDGCAGATGSKRPGSAHGEEAQYEKEKTSSSSGAGDAACCVC
jgi:hypothetical protein